MNNKMVLFLSAVIGLFIVDLIWLKFAPLFQISQWTPNLLLIILFTIGQIYGRRAGLLSGIWVGTMQDFHTEFYGFALLSYSVSGFLSGHYFKFNEHNNYINYAWGVLAVSLTNNILYMTLYFYNQQPFFEVIIQHVLPTSIYTVLFGLLLYVLTENWMINLYASGKSDRLGR